MRISITTAENATTFMRRAGYGYQKEGGGEVAFVRRVGGGDFPRYHAYVKEREVGGGRVEVGIQELQINLHIDQKAPTYGRNSVHSGEYEGTLVEQEAARFRAMVSVAPRADQPKPSEEKKGFFGKLFG